MGFNKVNWEWKAICSRYCCRMGMGPGAECTRTMISVIATICVSLVLLEMASSAILSAVLPVFFLFQCLKYYIISSTWNSQTLLSENSVEANLSQDDSQPDLSGLNSGAVLSGQPPCATLETQLFTGVSQVANPTSGELQLKKKHVVCRVGTFYGVLCHSFALCWAAYPSKHHFRIWHVQWAASLFVFGYICEQLFNNTSSYAS